MLTNIMSKCKYIKQKINKEIWCKYHNKKISKELCSRCSIENRYNKESSVLEQKSSVKSGKNKTISKLERYRFSILTNDLTKCIICGKKKEHLHEVYSGRNRSNSMKYGCVLPLCSNCHLEIHNNSVLSNHYKVLAQQAFIKVYPYLDFVEIFKRNYL